MTATAQPAARFPVVLAAGVLLAAAALLLAIAWISLPAMGLAHHRPLAFWAIIICAAFGLVGLAPVAVLDRRMIGGAAYGFMASMLLRMGGCGAAVFIARAQGAPPAFGYWVAGCYVVLLAVEVALVGRYVKKLAGPFPAASASPRNPRNPETDGCR